MSILHKSFSLPILSPMIMALFTLAACSPAGQTASPASSMDTASSMEASEMTVSSGSLDATGFVGQWTGPEGTALTITPAGGQYDVVIRNLDGPRDFSGTLKEDGIHLVRDGKPLVIHTGNGDDTGMKWLAGKQDCLVVDANEGYCRD